MSEKDMDIKIFMCCHKGYEIVPPFAVPIQGGRAIHPPIDGIMGDNSGDNISDKNKEYCELTVQYYVWKNIDADAYGFCHYRRFFCFDEAVKKPYLVFGKMSEKQQKRYLGSEEQIEKLVKEHDIVVPRTEKSDMTVREYYCHYENFFEEDLNLFLEILSKMHPELMPYAEEYLSQNYQYYCNMFIMKKQFFNEYCELLFPVLAEFDKRKTLHGNFQADRTNGYLAERFVGIYLYYAKAQGAKIKHISRIDAYSPLKKRILCKLLPAESKRRFWVKRVVGV